MNYFRHLVVTPVWKLSSTITILSWTAGLMGMCTHVLAGSTQGPHPALWPILLWWVCCPWVWWLHLLRVPQQQRVAPRLCGSSASHERRDERWKVGSQPVCVCMWDGVCVTMCVCHNVYVCVTMCVCVSVWVSMYVIMCVSVWGSICVSVCVSCCCFSFVVCVCCVQAWDSLDNWLESDCLGNMQASISYWYSVLEKGLWGFWAISSHRPLRSHIEYEIVLFKIFMYRPCL